MPLILQFGLDGLLRLCQATEMLAAAWLSAALFFRIVPVSRGTLGTPIAVLNGFIVTFQGCPEPVLYVTAVMLVLPHTWAFYRLVGLLLLGSRLRSATLGMIDGVWGVACLCASNAFSAMGFLLIRQAPNPVADALVWSGAVPVAVADLVVVAIAIGWAWMRRRRRGVDGAIRFPRAVLPALYGLAWFVHLEAAEWSGVYLVAWAVQAKPSMSDSPLHLTQAACALLAILSLIRTGYTPVAKTIDPAVHLER